MDCCSFLANVYIENNKILQMIDVTALKQFLSDNRMVVTVVYMI